ncbi:MAG TPA: tRNA (adenosine(37)-N6)-threonylcarbamoyltransferase complex ATPase subunit type 1 TsaE [Flavobacterium sp.]|nr:tRNA (adenosine(37)-N6)-threonylcarbamoyltransferase complex ATPase subunit type 1 TsaE [Flavobacterium sp.]
MERVFLLEEIDRIAADVLASASHPVIVLNGEMGAGKTTLVNAMCKALRVVDATSSPTFSLINEYRTDHGDPVFHIDAYRLKNEAEAFAIGMDEYLESGNRCFIEWAEKVPNLLPPTYSIIDLTTLPDGRRHLVLR